MVGKEIEIKLAVKDPKVLQAWLKENAKQIASSDQSDYYFDRLYKSFLFIDENGKKTADHYLRVRVDPNGKGSFCYKYVNRAEVKKEGAFVYEIETKVVDTKKIIDIVKAVGFTPILILKKHRKSYAYNNFQIDHDKVENLGEFVEIEYKGKLNNIKKAKKIGIHTKDATITLFGYKMRLIVSPPPPKQTDKKEPQSKERWYILTNDMNTSREDILTIYKTRFEIEEVFKDYKHIQKLKVLRIQKKETFTILLWFATIAFWVAWWIKGVQPGKNIHPKKKRSFFRVFWEELQRNLRSKQLHVLVPSG